MHAHKDHCCWHCHQGLPPHGSSSNWLGAPLSMHVCSQSCWCENSLVLCPLSLQLISSNGPQACMCSPGPNTHQSKNPPELCPSTCSRIGGNGLRFQPCLHMCPQSSQNPQLPESFLHRKHADNEAAMTDACPSLPVLTWDSYGGHTLHPACAPSCSPTALQSL